ncbi:uncharacterized protein LOC129728307 [Wyeomyia smithii]|uniref:uncharacterized protein LOC129728307 n=1 Tax=Wyeomyia smithii TaxID=174621 RepID=UPI002467DEF3|nr:uncharacterized protein LOC129728307 [Wyeomyia smithii]
MFVEAILGGFLLYIVWGLLYMRQRMKEMSKYFPGPKPNPVFGNVLEFYDKDIPGIFETIIDIHKRHGPDIILWTLGNISVIDVCSAKNVEKVVMAKQTQKSLLYSFVEPWLGDGLLISSGEKWFQRRKIITPTFHFKILEQFVTVFNKETDIMVENLRKHVGGKEFDIYDYVTLMALDSICETSMGTTVNAQMDPCNKYVQNVKRMSVLILLRVVSVLAGFPMLYTLLHPNAYEQRGIIKQLHKFTDSIIKSRRKQLEQEKMKQVNFDMNEENMYSKRKMTFLDLLLNINVDGKPLSDLDVREEVDTFMFEGHDTTTSGISFTIYLLALNQHIQQRAYDEIVAVLGKKAEPSVLSYQTLQEFRYLETVIKEAMRLYPPVPFIGRKLVDDLEMNGTVVKAGQDFLIPIYVIHRNPEIYPDPEKFDPDRFSETAESNRGPYDYIPFSAGSRNCIGQRYAMLEMKTTLIKLLWNYKILPGESLPRLRVKTDLVLRPDKGLPVKLIARSSLEYTASELDAEITSADVPLDLVDLSTFEITADMIVTAAKRLKTSFSVGPDECAAMLVEAIVIGIAIYLVVSFMTTRKELKQMASHFTGPKPNPIWGNVAMFANKDVAGIFETLIGFHTLYGKDIITWGPLNLTMINLTSAENVEKVIMSKKTKKSFIYDFVRPWLGDGLLISSGEKWFQRRKIITPTFHFKILENFVEVFNKESNIMVDVLKKQVDGPEFDIYNYITLMALDSICETSMGTAVNAQKNPHNKYVQNVKRMSVLILLQTVSFLSGFPLLHALFHPNEWEQRGIVRQLHQFTDSIIAERKAQLGSEKLKPVDFTNEEENLYSKRKMTFLDLLLNVRVEGKPMSNLDIREEVDTFMFEGHDTTTSGISFAIYQLALNQSIQDRIYDEIVKILGSQPLSKDLNYQDLQDFRYLEAVIKESMRLFPPVPLIGRQLVEDLEMNGTTVKAGQDVLIPIYVIHRNPEVFPDPERFDPERFTEAAESNRGPYDYIPFSAGSRNCIGQRYAMLEMKACLIKLISAYKIIPGESLGQLRVKTDLVLRPDKGIPVKLISRE